MSILDGMISSQAELAQVLGTSLAVTNHILKDVPFSEGARSVLELMGEGLSLADIFDITKEERDLVFANACRMVQTGERDKARDLLIRLNQLEPMDERPIYVLATIFQMEGKVETAGKLYVHFLALDATNVNGYLRLGECLLAAREVENAIAIFETAINLIAKGKGSPAAREHATKMLAVARQQLATN
jgi:tetratricopeptide (TPR) repeat protein